MIEWVNYINKSYINIAAPKVKIFKLDKTVTSVDTLYGEESSSRIYVPPFEMRAFMLTNPWRQLLGLEALREEEDNVQFVVNFEDMVQKIRAVKDLHTSEMRITYSGSEIPSAVKDGSVFILKLDGDTQTNYNLLDTNYNTVQKLGTSINSLDNYTVTLYGINDSSVDLRDFDETTYTNATLNIFSNDEVYDNLTDVIEAGDLILTNKWRLYEVFNANPSGDFGWDWVTYTLSCNLARLDQVQGLPGDYKQQIIENQYGLKSKVEME